MRRLRDFLARPFRDAFFGLEHCLEGGGRELALVFLGLILGWWAYVPLHELFHAWACLATGGEVTRLEIDTLYGGAWLASFIPWVVAGSEYAGRLSGFSTHGSDVIYLATDLGPYLLTLFPGVWLLRWAARRGVSLLFGALLPWALAPFVSLTGDAYEIGSILATSLPPWSTEAQRVLIRGDDLFLLPGRRAGHGAVSWTGVVLAASIGAAWAFLWWAMSAFLAARLGQRDLESALPRD